MRADAASTSAGPMSPCASKSARLRPIRSMAAARLSPRRPINTTSWPAAAKIWAMP